LDAAAGGHGPALGRPPHLELCGQPLRGRRPRRDEGPRLRHRLGDVLVQERPQPARLRPGLVDACDSIDFHLDGELADTLAGSGDGANLDEALATITDIGDAGMLDQVVLNSGVPAFELANMAAVPLPAGGLLLVGALGAAALLRRRKPA
jgi:hypothetical protein